MPVCLWVSLEQKYSIPGILPRLVAAAIFLTVMLFGVRLSSTQPWLSLYLTSHNIAGELAWRRCLVELGILICLQKPSFQYARLKQELECALLEY